jgi:hypothetical protein
MEDCVTLLLLTSPLYSPDPCQLQIKLLLTQKRWISGVV